eukprot:scaffold14552_cov27-Tisochrysis_lutea.AAC.4
MGRKCGDERWGTVSVVEGKDGLVDTDRGGGGLRIRQHDMRKKTAQIGSRRASVWERGDGG